MCRQGAPLGDALFYGSVWWSWVFPEGIVGLAIGLFAKKFAVRDGGFNQGKMLLFNIVQVIANAVAWIGLAPVLDIVVYKEPANKVFLQGFVAALANIVTTAIVGTILCAAYSAARPKKDSLEKKA